MSKKCFLKGIAAMAIAAIAVGCSHENDLYNISNADKLKNASERLGVTVDPNQDWNMTTELTAEITVTLGLDQEYTLAIYDENPLFKTDVHYYAKTKVNEGKTAQLSFSAPKASTTYYLAVFDSKMRRIVQAATVQNDKIVAHVGNNTAAARTRATEAEYQGSYAKTAADYLEGLTEANMRNYTAFTDNDLNTQSTLTNPVTSGGTTTTTASGSYKVPANYNPAAGTSVNVTNGSTKVGTLTFGNPVSVGETVEATFWYGSMNQTGQIFAMPNGDNGSSWKHGGAFELDATHTITLNPTKACTVTIEQATTNENTLKFDNAELSISSAAISNDRRIYTINNVSGGLHTISMGSGESGVWRVAVTYAGTTAATTDNSYNYASDGYTARLARTYYRFVPDVNCNTFTFYHKANASNNAITITDNGSYYQYNGQDFNNWSWGGADITLYNLTAGHTYEVTLNTSEDGCYGVKMEYSQTTTTNPVYIGNGDGRHYRVAAGTTINNVFHANGNDENQQPIMNGVVVYVQGTLNLYGYDNNKNTLNGVTIVVANEGEVKLHGTVDMSNYGRFVVLPGGKISGDDNASLKVNNGAKCYNAGEIDYKGELNVNGSDFYNNGTINLSSMRNTSGGKITNFGHIACGSNEIAADAYNCEMINGCYWHYTGNAGIGHLIMLKNSRLDVDGRAEFPQSWNSLDVQATTPDDLHSATIPNPHILMANSVVNVGEAYVTNTVFQGPTTAGEVAIVKMGKVLVGNGTDLMQRNNCYFDWDITELYNKQNEKYQDIPAEEKVYNPYGYLVDYYRGHVTMFVSEASSPFVIPAAENDADCTGDGYNPNGTATNPGTDPDDDNEEELPGSPAVWCYAFEDTPLGDYDMNDVVLKVSENKSDANKLDVTLCCAGASFDLYVHLGDKKIFGGVEVHRVLGQAAGSFINTGKGPDTDPVTVTVNKPEGFTFGTGDFFWIESPAVPGGVHIATAGTDPHGIVVPGDWEWPTEFTNIKDAYPNFVKFAADAATTDKDALEWYKKTDGNPVAGKVYKK